MLEQVVLPRSAAGDLAHARRDRGQRGGGTVQLLGGVGLCPFEPVLWRLGLLRAGAVARRGRPQQISTERGVAAEPGHVQRRGQHRPPVRVRCRGVLPAGHQLRRGGQGLGQPVAFRAERGGQPPVPGRRSPGPGPARPG